MLQHDKKTAKSMYYYYVLGKMLPVTVASVVSVVVGVALRFVEVLVTYGRHRALDLQMHDKGQGKRGGEEWK